MEQKIIYALGFFDGVHLGHGALLKTCRALAREHGAKTGVVTFGNHPDALVLGTSPTLITSLRERERLLRELYGVEEIITLPFDERLMHMPWQEFFSLLVETYHAAGLVCGDDFRFGDKGAGSGKTLLAACEARGLPCAVVPEQCMDGVRVSSTHIRSLLEAGDVATAARFLGHPYGITGRVVPGHQLGRTIGVPTANLAMEPGVLLPRLGVYACAAITGGVRYPAVANIGTRPTVGGSHVTVEPWLLGFDGDLYGGELTLELLKFLRPEKKFASLRELQAEIQKNADETMKIWEENSGKT